jgi:NAD(P)-dependent dehydrogenase (short-subunit alcohol dehydrogenase family)
VSGPAALEGTRVWVIGGSSGIGLGRSSRASVEPRYGSARAIRRGSTGHVASWALVCTAGAALGGSSDACLAQVARQLPVGRAGRPEDVAQAAFFLMTCGFVTGVVLPVDGGLRLG